LHQRTDENHLWEAKGGEIEKILRELCSWKQVNIVEAEIYPDHVQMLVEIPNLKGQPVTSLCGC
jgi:REP element-mobilizing transposase RayT